MPRRLATPAPPDVLGPVPDALPVGRPLLDVSDTGAVVPGPRCARLLGPHASADAQRGAGPGLAVARGLPGSRGGDLLYRAGGDGNALRAALRVATGTA